MLEQVPGVECVARNRINPARTQEVDLAFWNRRLRSGFYHIDTPFLVECKNWGRPVGGKEIVYFSNLLQSRCCRDGLLIASLGVTGEPGRLTEGFYELAMAASRGQRILVLTRAELERLRTTQELCGLLKAKILELTLLQTLR